MRDFAREFKRAIGRERELAKTDFEAIRKRSLFMSSIRRKIYQYLCAHPCDSITQLATAIGVRIPSIKHHLNVLSYRELVAYRKIRKRAVFYPAKFIDEKDIKLFAMLNDKKLKRIFGTILDSPAIAQRDVCELLKFTPQSVSAYMIQLERAGLITSVRDGRYKRYFPTKRIYQLERAYRKRMRRFKEFIMQQLRLDGLNPRLIRSSERSMLIQLRMGKDISTFEICTNPIRSTLAL
jgi:DNA-binding transcriptional ArsR family regulator